MFIFCIYLFLFQSTLSVRRATYHTNVTLKIAYKFQSTLSVRRATRGGFDVCRPAMISIHALREESDFCFVFTIKRRSNFNPRSPWGERLTSNFALNVLKLFQSTLSVRRATVCTSKTLLVCKISIHALREESDLYMYHLKSHRRISIHALREESDTNFLRGKGYVLISIHALREESDKIKDYR